jgi:hypothetical protein
MDLPADEECLPRGRREGTKILKDHSRAGASGALGRQKRLLGGLRKLPTMNPWLLQTEGPFRTLPEALRPQSPCARRGPVLDPDYPFPTIRAPAPSATRFRQQSAKARSLVRAGGCPSPADRMARRGTPAATHRLRPDNASFTASPAAKPMETAGTGRAISIAKRAGGLLRRRLSPSLLSPRARRRRKALVCRVGWVYGPCEVFPDALAGWRGERWRRRG